MSESTDIKTTRSGSGEIAAGGCSTGGCGSGGCGSGGCGSGSDASGGCGSGGCGTSACPSMHVYDWLSDMGIERPPAEDDVAQVAFKGGRKEFFRNPLGLDVHAGDYVIVEADRGTDFGTVHMIGELVELKLRRLEERDPKSFPKLLRLAEEEDLEQWQKNREGEGEAIQVCRGMVDRLSLKMKVADVEWQFDHRKITFYFTAERRVDFRQLVRDLARKFRTRVELRQIGVRDEAARLGGIGSCGRELCCSTWLEDFKPVSTQAAKTQDLPLNPVRLSGQCGRLKCCLNYELEQYMSALERFPSVGSRVSVQGKQGRVQKVDIFRELLVVRLEGEREEVEVGLEEAQSIKTSS